MPTSLGKPVIVDNRPGASKTVGAAMVAKADPDGYTLLQAAANMATNPILMTDMPFDAVKDFAPVSLTHLTPYVIPVSSQSPVKSLPELFKYIKDNPGKINYGTTGEGSPQQLATLLIAQIAGPLGTMTEVTYKGSSAAHPDLIANRISFMIDPLAAAGPHIKAGFCAGSRSARRSATRRFRTSPPRPRPAWPATNSRAGAACSRPRARRARSCKKLNSEIGAALGNPEFSKRFTDMGLVAKRSTPEEFGKFLQSEITRWRAMLAKKP